MVAEAAPTEAEDEAALEEWLLSPQNGAAAEPAPPEARQPEGEEEEEVAEYKSRQVSDRERARSR